ncbi:MAG TPA: hypothetical protein VFF59_09505 [Anaerolineae bacterium]|nr:hypothetical protein [Anaerolineae bacterium]
MSRLAFEEALQSTAAPRLSGCGYEYDDRLRDGDELFGFRKPLGDEVHAIVQVQRRGAEFTINLLRVSARDAELGPHVYGGYLGSLGARLSHVLWFVANVRDYGQPDRWWPLDDLDAVLAAVLRYGLPWLENPQASKPWEMPAQRWPEFAAAVTDSIASELATRGYRVAAQSLAGTFPYPYFVKQLPEGEFALIEFQSIYSLDPAQFTFDVRLQRKVTDNPLDFGGHYSEWRAASLGQLVWREQFVADETLVVDAVKSLLWHYADRAELDDRLGEVLAAIKRIALPWLEGNHRHAG